MRNNNIFESYIITETSLGIYCAQVLKIRGHRILGIISKNKDVIKWCKENDINNFLTIKEFQSINPLKTFDYFFSIVNGYILSPEILKYPRCYAINYHDAPLPRYAGIHSTSWAILNNEKTHGITWHIMSAVVDEGDVIEQAIIPIDDNDTALILNLKCSTQAVESFKLLVEKLEKPELTAHKQSLENRTYYGYHKKPQSSGLVNWNSAACDIDRLFRSLYFGNYANKLTSFKILIEKEVFFPHKIHICNKKSKNAKPGKLIEINNNEFQISTQTNDIVIGDITDIHGISYSSSDLINKFNLHIGYQFSFVRKNIEKRLNQLLTEISPCERFWVDRLKEFNPFILSFPMLNLCFTNQLDNKRKSGSSYRFLNVKVSESIVKKAYKVFDQILFEDLIISVFMIYFYRLEGKNLFSINYTNQDIQNFTYNLESFLSPEIFLTLDFSNSSSIGEAVEICAKIKSKFLEYKTYATDIKERYPELKVVDYIKPHVKINIMDTEKRLEEKYISHFLEICIDPKKNEYNLIWSAALGEIEQFFLEKISDRIKILLEFFVNNSTASTSLVPLPTVQEKKVYEEWNNTNKEYLRDKTLHEIFNDSATKYSSNIAVNCEGNILTYKQLNEKANQLAHYINKQLEIKPDTLIVLCLDRNEYLLIGILGVLKSGGAYVPVDPGYPDDRISYILNDTKSKLILTNTTYRKRLEKIYGHQGKQLAQVYPKLINLDCHKVQKEINLCSPTLPVNHTCSKDLAYVIYTSGTTGKPKGVMIEHRNIVNLVLAIKEILEVSDKDSFLFYRSYVFDGVIEETILPLISGATVNICISGIKDLPVFFKIIKENYVSIININSETIQALDDSLTRDLNVKKVIAGGTKFNTDSFSGLLKRNITIYNSYGPTECTVDSTYFKIDSKENNWIGKPIYNTKVYILDGLMNLKPVGAVGELYVGGDGVARGYLNLPELTKEKFVTNPFQTESERNDISYGEGGRNARLYKTGDLVRWLPDGNIEYIGRKDFQIKLRGYRIELGEIESVLLGYPGIKQSVVEAKERTLSNETKSGDKYLVGYYVSDGDIEEDKLFAYLNSKLPEYMIPGTLVQLSELPLTVNGKVDRKSLPEPTFIASRSYVEPRNDVEAQVIKIWCEVLGFREDTIGIKDDFFRLGGDSIVSIQIVSRLRQRLNLLVSVKDIFTYKTIEKLYDNVLSKVKEDVKEEIKSEQGILKGVVPLLPIQKWFFASEFKVQNYWNQSFIIKTSKLDIKCLESSVAKLVNYHDAFRLRYKKDQKGVYKQFYSEALNENKIRVLDINEIGGEKATERLSEILSNWQSEFDIEKGPMHVIGYLHGYEDGSSRVFVAMHHLIVDTVSWRIIKEDLQNIYNGKELGLKGSSYRQWVKAVENYGILNPKEKLYWNNILLDYKKENIEDKLGNGIYKEESKTSFSLSKELTKQLLQESNRAYNTQINDILLTALCYALNELTGDDVHHLVLEGHGREEIDHSIDITNTIGWFTTMYPIRLELRDDIGESIKYIKETLRQVPNRGIGYGPLIGYKEEILPKISFNYLGQFDYTTNSNSNVIPWQISNEDSGFSVDNKNNDGSFININSFVSNEMFISNIKCNFDIQKASSFTKIFENSLKKIVLNCICQNVLSYTPGDFNDFYPYVLFNQKKLIQPQNRLFLFPPGEGGAESYFNNVILNLENINLVVFNNYYNFLKEKNKTNLLKDITYEKLASHYIVYIKSIQAVGPYYLFGWSFGGVLALEIAKQLTAKGDKVKNIFMVDSLFDCDLANTKSNSNSMYIVDEINYKYLPRNLNLMNSKIHLFKASKYIDKKGISEDMCKFFKYYVEETECNHLRYILKKGANFKIEKLNSTHYNWINNQNDIKKICNLIIKEMQNNLSIS